MRRFGESLTTRLPRCPKPTELTSSICAVHVHPNAHSCSQLWRNQRRNPRFIESASQTHKLKRPPGPLFTQSQALEAQLSILPTTHSLGKGYHRPEFRHRFSAVPGDPRARIEVGRSYRAFARTRLLLTTTSVPSNRKTFVIFRSRHNILCGPRMRSRRQLVAHTTSFLFLCFSLTNHMRGTESVALP